MEEAPQRRRGEDFLDLIPDIVVKLEDGKTYRFKVRGEVAIPHGALELARAARTAPGRATFWAAQAERYRVAWQRAKRARERRQAAVDRGERQAIRDVGESFISDDEIKALVTGDVKARELAEQEDQWREKYELLSFLTRVLLERSYTIRRLLSPTEEREAS